MAQRKAAKSPSKRASTGLSAYTSRYALSDRLVCGECGTLYRRRTWTRPDGKRVVWRCVSRLDYGKKYCHSSPTLDEAPLQQAIIAALNTVLPDLDGRIRQITEALEAEVIPFPGSGMSLGDIERRLPELEVQFQRLLEKAALSRRRNTCKPPIPQPRAFLPAPCAGCGTSTGCTATRRSCWQRQCV